MLEVDIVRVTVYTHRKQTFVTSVHELLVSSLGSVKRVALAPPEWKILLVHDRRTRDAFGHMRKPSTTCSRTIS